MAWTSFFGFMAKFPIFLFISLENKNDVLSSSRKQFSLRVSIQIIWKTFFEKWEET